MILKHHQRSDILSVYDKKLLIQHSNKRYVAYNTENFLISNKMKSKDIMKSLNEEENSSSVSDSSLSLSQRTLAFLHHLVHLIGGSNTHFIFCLDMSQSEEGIKNQLRSYGIVEILLGKSEEILKEPKDCLISSRSCTNQRYNYVFSSPVKQTLSAIIIQRCWRAYKINRLLRETLEVKSNEL